MSETHFLLAAHQMGVSGSAHYATFPDDMAHNLLYAAKRHARFFEKISADISHRKALELVANCCGFQDWHAFQTTAKRLIDDFSPREYGSRPAPSMDRLTPFLAAMPLLISVAEDTSPTAEELSGLLLFRDRIAEKSGTPKESIADMLARIHGADNWDQLIRRDPASSKKPLYTFDVDHRGGGFVWSSACHALVKEMDELWQHYSDHPLAEQRKARKFITNIVAKRPDFLEGWLALASIDDLDDNALVSGPSFWEGIKRAEALIPAGFDDEISWFVIENRFYHRLLFNAMRWEAEFGSLPKAIKLARRQLRLNPGDNLGVRSELPVLLAANGQCKPALSAIKKFIGKAGYATDGAEYLVASLCNLACGEARTGHQLFLQALFEFPALRPIILDGRLPDIRGGDERWVRIVIPDTQSIWFHFRLIVSREPQIRTMYERILSHPDVVAAERETLALFKAARQRLHQDYGGGSGLSTWRDGSTKLAADLANRNFRAWVC